MQSAAFSTQLYRYLFYGWLFRDAGPGNTWERAAAWRYNRAQSRWLPTYMRRWAIGGALLLGIAVVFEYVVGPAKSASPTRVMPDCVAAPRLTISSR